VNNYKRLGVFNSGLLTNLSDGLFPVTKSISDKQSLEANQSGLTLVSKSSNPNYNLYKFTTCNHTAFLQPTHVRRKAFRCETCYLNNLSQTASSFGEMFVCRTEGTKQRIIRACGHIFDTRHAHKRKHETLKCSACFEEALSKLASQNNYEVVSFTGNSWKEVRLNCGHFKSAHISQIIKGNIICRVCLDLAHLEVIEDNGLKLLSKNADRYNEYLLPCGCNKIIRKDHAEDASWLCTTCDDTHYSKPSNVYLLEIKSKGFSWLKLGFAKDVDLRIRNYGLSKDSEVKILTKLKFSNGYDAMLFEKSLHKKYKSFRLKPVFMENYHTFNGHTECYELDVKEELLKEISLKGTQIE